MRNRNDRTDQRFTGRTDDPRNNGRRVTQGGEWSDRQPERHNPLYKTTGLDERDRGTWNAGGEPHYRERGWSDQRDFGNYGGGPWGGQVEQRGEEWRQRAQGVGAETSDWSAHDGRSERWGMGNTNEESDRHRQPSDDRYLASHGGYRHEGDPSWRGGPEGWRGTAANPVTTHGWGGTEVPRGPGQHAGWRGAPRGEYFGKGPKGYKRSDERIKEDVSERLSLGHIDASDVEVQVKDGEVTLNGTVPLRSMKRAAEEMVEDISGVHDVVNQLRVKRDEVTTSERSASANQESPRRSQPGSSNYNRS